MTVRVFLLPWLAITLVIGSLAAADTAIAFMRDDTVARQGVPSDVTPVATERRPKAKYLRKRVRIETEEAPGTIIVDTSSKYPAFPR